MAYYQARSGVCRSGVTYAGWTPPLGAITINGVDQTANIHLEELTTFQLNTKADGTPSTFSFITKPGFTPSHGQEVALYYALPNDCRFVGRILQMEAEKLNSTQVRWHCTAVGDQWLLDRYDRVLANYLSVGYGTIVADILARFTNGGFRVGYIPSSLGNVTMSFKFETVVGAMNRLAKAANAFWEIEFDGVSRLVNMFQTYPEQTPVTVTGDNTLAEGFTYKPDLTQVRTRVIFEGSGSTATVPTAAGSATIQVDDNSMFLAAGGSATAGYSVFTYTGTLTTISPIDGMPLRYITGVSGLLTDLAQGDAVDIIAVTVDAGDQAALAVRLGGGLSGQATNYLSDGRLSSTEATARGTTDIAVFGQPLEEAKWTYVTVQRWLRPGRSVTLNVSVPAVSGSFLVQEIQIVPIGPIGGRFTGFRQTASGAKFVRTVTDLLSQLPG